MITSADSAAVLEVLNLDIEQADTTYHDNDGSIEISSSTGWLVRMTPATRWQGVLLNVNGDTCKTAGERALTLSTEDSDKLKIAVSSLFGLELCDLEVPVNLAYAVSKLATLLGSPCDQVTALGYLFVLSNGIHVFNISVDEKSIEFVTQSDVADDVDMSFDDIANEFGEEYRNKFYELIEEITTIYNELD